jgi:myo-inositol-1(or 4)-monophosphatase
LGTREAAVAAEAVLMAGAIQKGRYGAKDLEIGFKGEIDLVTEVDKACEKAVVELLRSRFPSHDIVTEETHLAQTGSRYVWFIDPLDGTTNYAHGIPIFAVSIALETAGRVAVGVVFDPNQGELFTAERGRGAFVNGEPLAVSSAETLNESLLCTGFPYNVRETAENNFRQYTTFSLRTQGVRRMGSAVIYLAYVAAGRLDGYWELRLGPWDAAAGSLMVQEAGGRVTSVTGGPLDLDAPSIIASNGRIHDEMLRTLEEVR